MKNIREKQIKVHYTNSTPLFPPRIIRLYTRRQAVAGIADRTASHHRWEPSVAWPFDTLYAIFYWWSFANKPLSLTVSEIIIVVSNAMVDMALIRPLNKGRGHSFWYQSIPHMTINFCSRTHRLATIYTSQTDDRQTQHKRDR